MGDEINVETPGKQVSFASNHAVLLQLIPPYFKRVYGLRQVFTSAGAETVLKYEISFTYKKTVADDRRLFEIDRVSQVYINDTLPESVSDQLALQTGAVFYPLQVLVNFKGEFIAVANPEDLRERWKSTKESILDYFVGEDVIHYLEVTESVIADQHQLNEVISKDLVIRTFFAGIYRSYQNDQGMLTALSFPLIGQAAPWLFSVKQIVSPVYNHDGQIEIRHEGVSIDDRCIGDMIREDDYATMRFEDETIPKVEAGYKARYALNATTKSIEALEVSWQMKLQQEEAVSISMYEISGADQQSEEQLAKVSVQREKHEQAAGVSGFIKKLFG